jgi:hypothetical protein
MGFSKEFEKEIMGLHNKGLSATKIGEKLGKHTSSITRVIKRNGGELNFVYQGRGEEHSQWKGGRGIKSGYWAVYNPRHPRVMNNGRVYEHIVVAEKKLGRLIAKTEPIHHIDFNRLNNTPENLYVCENHKQHRDLHCSLEEIARELFRSGKLGFEGGKYVWVD